MPFGRTMRAIAFLIATTLTGLFLASSAPAQTDNPSNQDAAQSPVSANKDSGTSKPLGSQPPQIQKAFELANSGKYDESAKELKKYIKAGNEQCADCYESLGRVYLMQTKYKDAAASFRRALELKSPSEVQLYALLGVALYRQDDKKLLPEAITAFQQAIDLSKGQMAQAYYNLGYALLKLGKATEGAAALSTYLEKEPRANNASQIRALIKDPTLVDTPFAVPFSVVTNSGEAMSLDSLRGKVVLLDFWASWCLPCRQEMPNVRKVWKKYAGSDFVLLGVSLDSDAAHYQSFLEKEKMDWPQYFDNKGWANLLARLYAVRSIPRVVLIDQDGFIQATNLRGGALAKKVDELLKKRQAN